MKFTILKVLRDQIGLHLLCLGIGIRLNIESFPSLVALLLPLSDCTC